MESYCRGCLINYEDPAEFFQYTEKNRRLYVYSTGLQVKRNDMFPFQLCKDCYLNMKQSCKFKKQCRTSDRRLKNYFAMRETSDAQDFNTFLKNNDDLLLKFPIFNGSSTPANQRNRDDDNESTCTSIRNFISDLVPADELPDADARIVRELIEEEADVLDDSLDSRWLEDDADMSVGSDYRLDLSASPFRTPQSAGERYFRPQSFRLNILDTSQDRENINIIAKEIMNELDPKHGTSFETDGVKNIRDNKYISDKDVNSRIGKELPNLDIDSNIEPNDIEDLNKQPKEMLFGKDLSLDNELKFSKGTNEGKAFTNCSKTRGGKKGITFDQFGTKSKGKNLKLMKLYSDNLDDDIDDEFDERTSETDKANDENLEVVEEISKENTLSSEKDFKKMNFYVGNNESKHDVIDKNLEEALKNGEDKEYFLDDIINTPRNTTPLPAPNIASAMSTPTINNILFGKTLDIDYGNETPKLVGQYLEKCKDSASDIDIFEDFYYKEIDDVKIDTKDTTDSVFKAPLPLKYDLTDFSCKICNKKFNSEKGIKIHFKKQHFKSIVLPKKKYERPKMICDHCGKICFDRSTLVKHLAALHSNKNAVVACKLCSLQFTNSIRLKVHMKKIHNKEIRNKGTKKHIHTYVCPICGYQTTNSSNHSLHMARHNKQFSMHCSQCGKGFYRKSDLEDHERGHIGMKLFSCPQCNKRFARRDWLNVHLKEHNDDYRFTCEVCGVKFVLERLYKSHKSSQKCLENHLAVALQRHQEKEGNGKTYYYVTEQLVNPKSLKNLKKYLTVDGKKLMEDINSEGAVKVVEFNETDNEKDSIEKQQRDKTTEIEITSENHEHSDLKDKNQTVSENLIDTPSENSKNSNEVDAEAYKSYELPDLGFDTEICDETRNNNAMEVDSKVNQHDNGSVSGTDIEMLLKM